MKDGIKAMNDQEQKQIVKQQNKKHRWRGKFCPPCLDAEYGFSDLTKKVGEVFTMPTAISGQELLVTGYIGLGGTSWMLEYAESELKKTLSPDFLQDGLEKIRRFIRQVPEAAVASQHGITAMHHITDGGIYAGLWQLAQAYQIGFHVDFEAIPVNQITIECCEVFDLNPYQLYSGSCFLLVANHGYEVMQIFQEMGIPCTVIGRITDNQDKFIKHEDGGSFVSRPAPDELLKIRMNFMMPENV
jgi:hydrogenase maturation factor